VQMRGPGRGRPRLCRVQLLNRVTFHVLGGWRQSFTYVSVTKCDLELLTGLQAHQPSSSARPISFRQMNFAQRFVVSCHDQRESRSGFEAVVLDAGVTHSSSRSDEFRR